MITLAAKQLSAKAKSINILEDLGNTSIQELVDELIKNCSPTDDEIIELLDGLVYKPLDYYAIMDNLRSVS
jgi:hypothetical protein